MNHNRCPVTLEPCTGTYSANGLRKLSPRLKDLKPFSLSAREQREEAALRAARLSIQGVQAKLSVKLNIKEEKFELADKGGTYILKPQSHLYPELPQNESLTMTLADLAGIDTPFHGLVYSADGTFSYFVKRFDRYGKNKKHALEDFAQLTGKNRDTKYDFSMEKIVPIIDKYTSFPMLEKRKLFLRTVFNFFTGNEDMHLKNFSLITRENKIELSPAYDLLNTTIVMKNHEHEIALPLKGRTKNITKKLLVDYFAYEKLELPQKIVKSILEDLEKSSEKFKEIIKISFLSDQMKDKFLDLYTRRTELFF